jgi:hypothetical protein
LINQEQFSEFISYFTQKGYTVYIPEIEGSLLYCERQLPEGFNTDWFQQGNFPDNLSGSGLNEFTQNYSFDVKDVINYITKTHPSTKIDIIAHSHGVHQIMRSLQIHEDLKEHIHTVTNIAGSYNVGLSKFWRGINYADKLSLQEESDYERNFYKQVKYNCTDFFKSFSHIMNDKENNMTEKYNPVVNESLNNSFSSYYNSIENFPKFLFIHALDDKNICAQDSILMYIKFRNNGGQASLLLLEKGEHCFIENDDKFCYMIKEVSSKIASFLESPHSNQINNEALLSTCEDVKTEYENFMLNQEEYLRNRGSTLITSSILKP